MSWQVLVEFLVAQVKAGAQLLQVFESHAGLLDADLFSKFCIPYLSTIVKNVKDQLKEDAVPMVLLVLLGNYFLFFQIVFARGAHHSLPSIASMGYDVISIDWTIDPVLARYMNDCVLNLFYLGHLLVQESLYKVI